MEENKNNLNGPQKKNNNNNKKYLIIYVIVAFMFIYSFNYAKNMLTTQEISYNKFMQLVKNGEISEVRTEGDSLVITPKEGSSESGKMLYTGEVLDPNLVETLQNNGVEYYGNITEQQSMIMELLVYYIVPILLMFFLFKFLFRKMGGKFGAGPMNMGKSNAKMYVETDVKVTFDDVAGQDEAKESLTEIIDFLNNPAKYASIGAKLPKGALLVGHPAAKVSDLFKEAEKHAPCIIFIDEIDSIGKSRDNQMQSNDEREQTLNQLLTEMDGFDATKGIVILGATNRPEILDKALLRPGRFDRRVIVDRPDLIGRKAILKVHSKDVKLADDVDLDSIAKGTPGAVGADLANMINEAAIRAVKHGRDEVIQEDLEEAVEVIIAGKEKKDRILSKQERKIVAFHEVGHALVAGLLEGTDPVHKITIVPRTMGALGYTMQLPEEEKYLVSKEEMLNQITVMLGGRAAEEVVFNMVSTGASNDIERATQSARSMVTVYGMTERFDMMALESIQNRYLDGRAVRNCSEETSTLVDEEILKIIRQCHNKAIELLTENRDLLDEISEYLLEKETIFGTDFERFIYNKYPELKKIKEKEKEENKLDLEKEENNDDHEAKEENHENHEDKENEVASTIDMIIE